MSSPRNPVDLIELQMDPHLLTTEQAAEWLAVSVRTVKNLMTRGQLSYVKIGTPTRFVPADLLDELQGLTLRHWVHTLEYRCPWLTKSRTWSTTFTELRAARQRWRLDKLGITPEQEALRFGEWEYKGIGYQTACDAWLANSANASAKRARPVAWEER